MRSTCTGPLTRIIFIIIFIQSKWGPTDRNRELCRFLRAISGTSLSVCRKGNPHLSYLSSSHPTTFTFLPPPPLPHSPFFFETSFFSFFFDAPSEPFIPQASHCSGCSTRGGLVVGIRKHTSDVLQSSSAPPLDLSKVVNRIFHCSGSHPLWSVRFHRLQSRRY